MHIKLGDRDIPQIYEAQKTLKLLGFYHFQIDGDFGPGTERAIRLFQHKSELPINGILDQATFDKLKAKENELGISVNMPNFSMEDILEAYHKKGYKINEEQYKINLLGIRKDDVFDNMFTDRLVIFWKNEAKEWEKKEFEWTTTAGTLGRGGALDPFTVDGVTGVAILQEGQYLDTWTFYDTYTQWLNYPWLQQEKPLKVLRDGKVDQILDYDSKEQYGLFGINIHRMSGNGQYQQYVNSQFATWSAGCQGAPEPVFRQVLDLIRVSSKFHGNVYSYTLMHRRDLVQDNGLESLTNQGYFTAMI